MTRLNGGLPLKNRGRIFLLDALPIHTTNNVNLQEKMSEFQPSQKK